MTGNICFSLECFVLLLALSGLIPTEYWWITSAIFCLLCFLEAVFNLYRLFSPTHHVSSGNTT
ncbi:hypothetical protein LEI94_22900 [Salmonella enterica]|uniref:hypothetical protein n=1 Tax=Salmonella sp. SAL04162 TaxID=3159782 RepID=UPI002A1C1E67|nr:hypothetical protein [Salmonella enterica]MDJ6367180.1 hypothetical protein [Salmonella enterica]